MVSQIPKIIGKIEPAVSGLSAAFSSGSSVQIMGGVLALVCNTGNSAEKTQILVNKTGRAASGVVIAMELLMIKMLNQVQKYNSILINNLSLK